MCARRWGASCAACAADGVRRPPAADLLSGTRASFDFELLDEYAESRSSSALPLPALLGILALFSSLWVPPLVAAALGRLVAAANIGVVLLLPALQAASTPAKFNAAPVDGDLHRGRDRSTASAWSLLALFTLVGAITQNLAVVMFAMVLVGIAANAVSTRTLPRATLMQHAAGDADGLDQSDLVGGGSRSTIRSPR